MVVCTMQSFTTDQQLNGCSAMKSAQTSQVPEPEMVDNGNGAEEDREEGEIVDEFEMIISSEDEEFKLRARIQQLEDKSKDIEKMDMLSANLANQYSYQRPQGIERLAPYQYFSPTSVLSDVSSLSEEEFDPPKKYRKHRMKRTESRRHGPMYRRNPFANRVHAQQAHARKKRRHEHHSNHHHHQQATILLDSLDSVTDDEVCEYDLNVENENDEELKLSRNKLRMALARDSNYDIKPKHSLRERLQYRMRKSPSPSRNQVENQIKTQDQLPPHSFEGYSQHRNVREEDEEQQQQMGQAEDLPELKLRLIALKSAILKKHIARKKRDAERAYSPTDMISRVHQPTVSNECDDIDDLMEISPAASPERTVYSPQPTRFAEPVDMELAQTDSDEEIQQWPHHWQSTVNSGGSWRCFMPNSLPPVSMPIVIDDDEEELQQDQRKEEEVLDDEDDEVPPPPPSFHIPHVQLDDDDARDALHLSERHSHQDTISDIQSISMDNSQTQTSRPLQPESSDDEAGALRAMLLSKLKPAADTKVAKVSLPASVQNETVAHDSDDPEELRQLLLSSIASRKKNSPEKITHESPEILKNAVRRFKASSLQSNEVLPPEQTQQDVPLEPAQQTEVKLQHAALPLPLSEPLSKPEPVPVPVPLPLPVTVPVPLPVPLPVLVPLPVPAPPPQLPVEVSAAPTPAIASTSTNIIKIVKPNKVINKKTAPKRKISKLAELATAAKRPATLLVKESVAPLHSQNGSSSTRLITTLDPSSIKVNKLVIALAESSAGSDDELELRSCYAYSSYASYADNASPFSQAMDSASNSTTRSNTPNSEILESASTSNPNLRRTVINEYFEKKLDDFLKQARSKVPTALPADSPKPTPKTEKSSDQPPKAAEKSAVIPQKAKPTPVAVRHLPVASQREYLRLIERMQLLEKKKVGVGVKAVNIQTTAAAKEAPVAVTVGKQQISVGAALAAKAKTTAAGSKALKKVTVRAGPKGTKPAVAPNDPVATATDTTTASDFPSTSKAVAKATQPSKESRLKAFESSFLKIGGSMIANLDKSLHMVEEAKKSKIARLRYSHRLKDLYAEMQAVKQSVKLEESKLARIQSEIQASHEIIISLKQKRNKLQNAALDLGNGLQGADYRLLDPAKAEISRKSTELTKEIRLYNSILKYEDVLVQADVSAHKEVTQSESKPDVEPQSVPEPKHETSRDPSEQPISSSDSNSQPPADERQSTEPETETEQQPKDQPSECNTSAAMAAAAEVAVAVAGEEAVTVKRQLEFDITPRNVAPDATEVQKAPPYTVSFMRELCNPPVKKSLLGEYRTPLSRNYNSQLNVNATVCPFELMGRCEDSDCSYLHLTRAASSAVVVTALKQ
ncbi:uncharacterized protein LOC135431399 [Drosophila montana]|uniref:uncharacterized protein LOC135431399 n=1 Tax=Drosophila montana TaxID=40370 RepID=UPI00313EBB4C